MDMVAVSACVQVLIDRMATKEFINFFRKRKRTADEGLLLSNLRFALKQVGPLLDEELTNDADTGLVKEAKNAYYQADELVDVIATESKRSKSDSKVSNSNFFSWFLSGDDTESISSKIQQIIEKLESLTVIAKNTRDRRLAVGRPPKILPTTCLLDVQVPVYGRENDKEKLIQLLISSDHHHHHHQVISVIPIVGMPGVGKTTLAQLVYNDSRIDSTHFEIQLWVFVSQEFRIENVTKTILEGLTRQKQDTEDLNLLQLDLKARLAGKKFLIVFDDLWNANRQHWETLTAPLKSGERGSKIIVTTRNECVASTTRTGQIFHLEQLSNEDCWQLFSRRAFENVSPVVRPKFELIGRKILHKYQGLPSAAKTLGDILSSKVEIEEWTNILENPLWDLPKDKSNIFQDLWLSYVDLPFHLKLCFDYCANIPKDYAFEKDELVQLWRAEGLLHQPRNNRTSKEIGDGYFDDLLSRSFFQQSSGNKFVMHGVFQDLAQFVAGKYCCRQEDGHQPNFSEDLRHFSFLKERCDLSAILKEIPEDNCLRTLISWRLLGTKPQSSYPLSKEVLYDALPKLRRIRVLCLSEYDIDELPDSIGDLKYLRYLDLSYTHINCLPKTISKLCNLETLLLRGCQHLKRFPADFYKLPCLCELDTLGTNLVEMPMRFGTLTSLQLLTKFVVGKQIWSRISELKDLNHLRGTLSISNIQNVLNARDAMEANLKNKKYLVELKLEWGDRCVDPQNEREVLDKLKPHTHLKHLTIKNYGGTSFSGWLGQLPYLQELTLESMKNIETGQFPKHLPCLKKLVIADCPRLMIENILKWDDDAQMVTDSATGSLPVHQHLSSLQALVIAKISDLPSLTLDLCRLTNLEELSISDCSMLNTIIPFIGGDRPSHSSLPEEEMKHLQKLSIINCPQLDLQLSEDMEHHYRFLQDLTISRISCDSLQSFPLGFFPKLHSLSISECNFQSLSVLGGLQSLTSLESLHIKSCANMVLFAGGLPAPNLNNFVIDSCEKLKELPEQMCTLLKSLQSLVMSGLPEIESFPLGGLPSNLSSLTISRCDKLLARRTEWGLQTLLSLRFCSIEGECKEDKLLESFPAECQLPTSLTHLEIKKCPNLISLDSNGLRHLNCLENLLISDCWMLQSLPDEGLPSSLLSLTIRGCPLLKVRCQRDQGEDWFQISHIPNIEITDGS